MKKMTSRSHSTRIISCLVFGVCLFSLVGCGSKTEEQSGDLTIFHAGSLSVPFKEISEAFMAENPGVNVLLEAAGSRTCARKISDLNRPCDVMASADYAVIDGLLIPDHADWNIHFVSNEMVIVYGDHSPQHETFNADNWFDVIKSENVVFGRAEPDSDPCGYRTVFAMKLAETHYKRAGLADELLKKDLEYIRPKETDLIALFETGTVDYFFIYRSVAEQHGMQYLLLPDEINLKKPALAESYRTATIELSGKKPGETITRNGEPMVYGVTIPKNAPNPTAALLFVEFLLSEKQGMAIMAKNGQPSVVPAATSSFALIPESLKGFASR
jgi:molybdate/tungstate transport system substrate-binding protein